MNIEIQKTHILWLKELSRCLSRRFSLRLGHLFLISFVKYVSSKFTQSKRGYSSVRLYGQYFVRLDIVLFISEP